jgi:DNA-binding PadR family transcriptional regulator
MVDDGLLTSVVPRHDETSGGPPRRYYRITEYGRTVARAEGRRITRLHQMVAGTSLLSGTGSTPGGG